MGHSLSLQGLDERTRLSDAVYETLLEAILTGQLAAGTTVSEVKLAEELNVSRVEGLQQALDEHFQILDALEKRDQEQARTAMAEHIAEWQAYFVNHLQR